MNEQRKRLHHDLKTDPLTFSASAEGVKPWEVRKNDRDFQEGDTVTLHETQSTGQEMAEGAPLQYTGRTVHGIITWVLHGPQYGLEDGWCIFTMAAGFADSSEEIEARLQYNLENSCPHCGGSGHKDDCQEKNVPHASLEVMGNIQIDEGGELQTYYKALVITFKNTDEIRAAIDVGECTFGFKE